MGFLGYLATLATSETAQHTQHSPPEAGKPYDLGVVTRGNIKASDIKMGFMEGIIEYGQPAFLYRAQLAHEVGAIDGSGKRPEGRIAEAYILIPGKGAVFVQRKPEYNGDNRDNGDSGKTSKLNPSKLNRAAIDDALKAILGFGDVEYAATGHGYVTAKKWDGDPEITQISEKIKVTRELREILHAML